MKIVFAYIKAYKLKRQGKCTGCAAPSTWSVYSVVFKYRRQLCQKCFDKASALEVSIED